MPAHNKPVGPFTVNEVLRLSIEQMSGNGSSRRARQMAEVERRVERLQGAAEHTANILSSYVMPQLKREVPRLDPAHTASLNEATYDLLLALQECRRPIHA